MDVVLWCAGLAIIALVLWQVFSDLWHPGAEAALSDFIGRSLFTLLRRSWVESLPVAGPLAVVLVILTWVAGLVVGFALLYVGQFPLDFQTGTGEIPPQTDRVLASLYFSFETLITLGYGDLEPASELMRFTSAFEALVGFGLLTASVSSIVLLYPALSRMRLLARTVYHVVEAERRTGIPLTHAGLHALLSDLTRRVTQARTDLVHFPVIYYFAPSHVEGSVARWTAELERLAREGSVESATPEVRFAACMLQAALDDFAAILAERFLRIPHENRNDVFRAFAVDQAIDVRTPSSQ